MKTEIKEMANLKVRHTLATGGEVSHKMSDEVFSTDAQCLAYIKRKLSETYGKDWKKLHGDDLTMGKDGSPYYYFYMGEGDYEKYEVMAVKA